MSAPTAVRPDVARPAGTANLVNVVRSEWIKMWSVRSTMWTMLLLVALTIGFGVLFTWGTKTSWSQMPAEARATFDPTSISLAGLVFAQIAVAVLGVMMISSEYSTGGIRTTLTAVPRRTRLLLAKAIVLAASTLVVGIVTSFLAFFAGQRVLGDLSTSIGEPGVLRAVIGGGLYVLATGLFGFALGALLRHTAGGITVAVSLLLVVPPLLLLLPGDWGHTIYKYFTSNAGQQITAVRDAPDMLGPWEGYLVFTIWWVVILAVAAWLMNRRDA